MKNTAFLLRLSAVALVAAASTYPLISQAAILKAGAAVEVGVADRGLTSFTGFHDVIDNPPASETSTIDFDITSGLAYLWDGDNYASAEAAANQDGWMYSIAGGSNTFKSVSHVQQSLTITNNTAVDQNYSFDFTILNGSLSANGSPVDSFTGVEFAAAGNLVSISLDGVELFGSAALLVVDSTGADFLTAGEILGNYTADSLTYYWGERSDTLDLGVLAAGESFTLTYDIVTAATGIYHFDGSSACNYGGSSDAVFAGGERCFFDQSGAYSLFGDPNGVGQSPIAGNVQGTPVMSVPEPSLWLLMGTGLFGFAVARRRKVAKA